MEEELGRPLQRVLCLKYTIEIIWHKYFIALDGETSSPTTLTGPIGKVVSGNSFFRSEIITYSTMRPKRPLPKLSKKVISQMSCDQAYLYRIVQTIVNGSKQFGEDMDKGLATACPGKLHNARWLTLANRVLRLYCSEPEPSNNLKLLVRFILDVYAPAWFDVVQNPSFLDEPRIFHRLVASLDMFPLRVKERKVLEDAIN